MSKKSPSSNRKAIGIQEDNHKQIRMLAREGSANFNDVIGALLELMDRPKLVQHLKNQAKEREVAKKKAKLRKAAILSKLSTLNDAELDALLKRL